MFRNVTNKERVDHQQHVAPPVKTFARQKKKTVVIQQTYKNLALRRLPVYALRLPKDFKKTQS